ncbi:MAG: PIN domain-containing protein [Prevotella sp.]|nr:PIN domain-containing protein [Prevotella sp.]
MKVFVDTNILIDVLARREGFYEASSNILNLGIIGKTSLFTTSLSFATTSFVVRKVLGYKNTILALQELERFMKIAPMDATQCHRALHAPMPDFEDMLQYEAASTAQCDVIITRNVKHFPEGAIKIMTPVDFLSSHYCP